MRWIPAGAFLLRYDRPMPGRPTQQRLVGDVKERRRGPPPIEAPNGELIDPAHVHQVDGPDDAPRQPVVRAERESEVARKAKCGSKTRPWSTSTIPPGSHVLLALAAAPLHGYAVKQRIEAESDRSLTPQPGSLYRVIARLMTAGLVVETDPKGPLAPHPGLSRRYYALTPAGRRALGAEAHRLKGAAALAEKRLRTVRP